MAPRRRFNRRERMKLYVRSGGYCVNCGAPLERNWHADHILAYTKGGQTQLGNGQALCAQCNLQKGSKMMLGTIRLPKWPDNPVLRTWQQKAVHETQVAMSKNQRDYLTVAVPGAGKTVYATRVVYDAFLAGYERVFVVLPSERLKYQWANVMAKFGIQIEPSFKNSTGWPRGFHGVSVTYQQVAASGAPLFFQTLCHTGSIVVLDELHHCGVNKTWGESLETAFRHAGFRLCLSGTPFRTDREAVPFLHYDTKGRLQINSRYSFREAMIDRVNRPPFFPKMGGEVEWWEDGALMEEVLGSEVDEEDESRLLRACLSFSGDWPRDTFIQANNQLQVIRAGEHKNAKGLIIADSFKDQSESKIVKSWEKLIKKETGINPVVVVSDPLTANGTIEQFTRSGVDGPQWIISIRMVSEGVDIPDLRVGIIATRTRTELSFRQQVGRFLRYMPSLKSSQPAFIYIPNTPTFIRLAQEFRDERDAVLKEIGWQPRSGYNTTGERLSVSQSDFIVVNSNAEHVGAIFGVDGSELERKTVEEARPIAQRLQQTGLAYTAEEIALIIKLNSAPREADGSINAVQHEEALWEVKDRLQGRRVEIVTECAKSLAVTIGVNYDNNKDVLLSALQWYAKTKFRGMPSELSVEELEAQINWLPQIATDPPEKLISHVQYLLSQKRSGYGRRTK